LLWSPDILQYYPHDEKYISIVKEMNDPSTLEKRNEIKEKILAHVQERKDKGEVLTEDSEGEEQEANKNKADRTRKDRRNRATNLKEETNGGDANSANNEKQEAEQDDFFLQVTPDQEKKKRIRANREREEPPKKQKTEKTDAKKDNTALAQPPATMTEEPATSRTSVGTHRPFGQAEPKRRSAGPTQKKEEKTTQSPLNQNQNQKNNSKKRNVHQTTAVSPPSPPEEGVLELPSRKKKKKYAHIHAYTFISLVALTLAFCSDRGGEFAPTLLRNLEERDSLGAPAPVLKTAKSHIKF